MEEEKKTVEERLVDIENNIEKAKIIEDCAGMEVPMNGSGFYDAERMYYYILKDLKDLKNECQDPSLLKKIDSLIEEISDRKRHANNIAQEIAHHEEIYGRHDFY